jgi:hypothetical protein
MATLNFLDLAKANSNDAIAGIIEDLTNISPELSFFPASSELLENRGQMAYKTLHRVSRPTVEFAHNGEGFTPSKSETRLLDHQCFRFGGRVEAFKHIADNWGRGGAAGYQTFEAAGIIDAALQKMGSQIWDGVSSDAKGFPGIKAFTPFGGAYTYNAAGTTAATASSVYFVKFGERFCQLMPALARNGNGIFDLPDFMIESILDPNNKKAWAYTSELSSYMGLQITSNHSVARICNLTADSGKGMTDAKADEALSLFPAQFKPDAIFLSRRSKKQWRQSRTMSLMGVGTQRPDQPITVPNFNDYEGIPVIETDNILNTYAIEA